MYPIYIEKKHKVVLTPRFVETEKRIFLRFPVPGIPDRGYDVSLIDGLLTITAREARPAGAKAAKGAKGAAASVAAGNKYHQFPMPLPLSEGDCEFKVTDGTLSVSFAKDHVDEPDTSELN